MIEGCRDPTTTGTIHCENEIIKETNDKQAIVLHRYSSYYVDDEDDDLRIYYQVLDF